jgi:hypothetical protein
MNREY